jgi:hypothetical protein
MRNAVLLFLLISCLLLSGCLPDQVTTQASTASTTVPGPTGAPLASPAVPVTPAATDQPEINGRTHYRIDATLDDSMHSLQVQEEILFSNPTGLALDSLPLVVEANLYENSFAILNISSSPDHTVEVENLDLNLLTLHLQPALPAGETLTLTLAYTLDLPPIKADESQIFGYTQRQINLVDWYAFLPPFNPSQGWLVHPPAAVGEHTVYSAADFDVQLHLPQLNPALVVAAAAPAEAIADGYRYHVESARNFTWSASQQYRVSTQQAGPVTVTSYAYPATELAARAALDYTVQAINYFSKQFALEPRNSLSIIQADFPDGMEYDGLYFLSERFYYGFDGSARSYLALIAVHETAHQWWYARVASDQALEPWQDEALCVYSELLFYQNLNPELADWWWKFRVEPYSPEGTLSATIYDFAQFTPYRNRVYLQGAQFLDALRQSMGDKAFFNALQTYAQRFDGQFAERQDFLDILQQATSTDLSALISRFFGP